MVRCSAKLQFWGKDAWIHANRIQYPVSLTCEVLQVSASGYHANAPTESLWSRLKAARVYGKKFATTQEGIDAVLDWIHFYNSERLHSTLDYVSPMHFEASWHAAQPQMAAWQAWLRDAFNRGKVSLGNDCRSPSNPHRACRQSGRTALCPGS
jgi:Integrase core domain